MKPFEEHICEILTGDTQKNALDFAVFLKANNMTTNESHGVVLYGGEEIVYMHMDGKADMPGPWTLWPSIKGTVPDGYTLDDATIAVAHANVNICADCGSGCAPGSTQVIYGKTFDNVCGAMLAFTDPRGEALECVKKILELIKYDVSK